MTFCYFSGQKYLTCRLLLREVVEGVVVAAEERGDPEQEQDGHLLGPKAGELAEDLLPGVLGPAAARTHHQGGHPEACLSADQWISVSVGAVSRQNWLLADFLHFAGRIIETRIRSWRRHLFHSLHLQSMLLYSTIMWIVAVVLFEYCIQVIVKTIQHFVEKVKICYPALNYSISLIAINPYCWEYKLIFWYNCKVKIPLYFKYLDM